MDILNSISQLPDVKNAEGSPITPAWNSAGVYWKDLPEFTMTFREYGIGKSSIYHDISLVSKFFRLLRRSLNSRETDIQPEDDMGDKWVIRSCL